MSNENLTPSTNESDKKKRKRNLRVPIVASTDTEQPKQPVEAKPKHVPSPAEKALANLVNTKRTEELSSERAKPVAGETKQADVPESSYKGSNTDSEIDETASRTVQTEVGATGDKTKSGDTESDMSEYNYDGETTELPDQVKIDDGETYETWDSRELGANELNLGEGVREVVVNLRGGDASPTEISYKQAEDVAVPQPETAFNPAKQNHDTIASEAPPLFDGGGEKPPIDPPESGGNKLGDQEPEDGSRRSLGGSQANTALPPEVYTSELFRNQDESGLSTVPVEAPRPKNDPNRLVTQRELNDSMYRAEKAGQNRGVLTGLLVGGAYEHFKHKRREKRLRKDLVKQGKRLDQAEKRFVTTEAEHTKNQHAQERRFASAQKEVSKRPADKLEKQPPSTEKRMVKQPEQELVVPEGHHLETSAWHTIEVDNKTGRTVENSAIQYGHEYYQERRSESGQHDDVSAVAGEMALIAAAGATYADDTKKADDKDENTRAKAIPSASTSGAPSKREKLQSAAQSFKSGTTTNDGPVWPLVVVLIVVIMIIFVLLR